MMGDTEERGGDYDGLCWRCENHAANPFDDRGLCGECADEAALDDMAEDNERRERNDDLEEKN